MNMNDAKNVANRVSHPYNKLSDRPKVSHKDRGDANKLDTPNINTRKNEDISKFKSNKLKTNVDRPHNVNLSKSDKREVTEVKDLRKDTKNQKDDKAKISEDVGKNTKKPIPKAATNKEATKNATEANKILTEPKSQKTLRINIPNINEKKEKIKKTVKNLCKTDLKGSRNRTLSPILTKKASPSTEVAKWSGNKLAKPYYEAWVNFAGMSKNMTMLEKNTRFQKQLKRYRSPELLYENYADEKFTGRIKVNYK